VVAEALECLGGNGYVEESGLPRLYRETPLNSIWEGSGNVNALDVLRIIRRTPDAAEAFFAEIGRSSGTDRRLDGFVGRLKDDIGGADQARARDVTERLAQALQGSLLVRHGSPAVADAFCATRLGGEGRRSYGTLPTSADAGAIVNRHRPA
jgi:putative acyl-CoA dehydrogenase